jgi:hypothetical protein
MSLIHTCELNKAKPFDYLTEARSGTPGRKQQCPAAAKTA